MSDKEEIIDGTQPEPENNDHEQDMRGVLEGDAAKTFMGHPQGLFYLFFVEMWERFSYYGMRALLVLYLTQQVLADLSAGVAKETAFGIYAGYGSLVYLTPLFGGMIADRLIGQKKAIIVGCVLMTTGHAFMAFDQNFTFYLALGFLIVGNGFFKPNIATIVGGLYKPGDPRRDGGYTIFYMGVNTGSFLATLLCGWLATFGWHYGFSAAGVGMACGLILFLYANKKGMFGHQGEQPKKFQVKKFFGQNIYTIVILLGFIAVPVFSLIVRFNAYEILGSLGIQTGMLGILVFLITIGIILYLLYILFSVSKIERARLLVCIIYTFSAILFWMFFEQSGSSLTLFAEENVNMWLINAAQSTSLNAGYIMVLAIPLSLMWAKLGRIGLNPNSTVKLGLGIILLGVGFFIFAYSSRFMDGAGRVPFFFFAFGWLVVTIGELFFSPIGQSKINALTPKKLLSFMMGVWFLASFFAHYLSGIIATQTSGTSETKTEGNFITSIVDGITGFTNGQAAEGAVIGVQNLANYTNVFGTIGVISVGFGAILLLLSPLIKRMMHGVK